MQSSNKKAYHSSRDRRCTFVMHLSTGHAPSSLFCNRDILSSRNKFHATHQTHSHTLCFHKLSCGLSRACHRQAHCSNRHRRKYDQQLVCQICKVSHKQHPSIPAGRCTWVFHCPLWVGCTYRVHYSPDHLGSLECRMQHLTSLEHMYIQRSLCYSYHGYYSRKATQDSFQFHRHLLCIPRFYRRHTCHSCTFHSASTRYYSPNRRNKGGKCNLTSYHSSFH